MAPVQLSAAGYTEAATSYYGALNPRAHPAVNECHAAKESLQFPSAAHSLRHEPLSASNSARGDLTRHRQPVAGHPIVDHNPDASRGVAQSWRGPPRANQPHSQTTRPTKELLTHVPTARAQTNNVDSAVCVSTASGTERRADPACRGAEEAPPSGPPNLGGSRGSSSSGPCVVPRPCGPASAVRSSAGDDRVGSIQARRWAVAPATGAAPPPAFDAACVVAVTTRNATKGLSAQIVTPCSPPTFAPKHLAHDPSSLIAPAAPARRKSPAGSGVDDPWRLSWSGRSAGSGLKSGVKAAECDDRADSSKQRRGTISKAVAPGGLRSSGSISTAASGSNCSLRSLGSRGSSRSSVASAHSEVRAQPGGSGPQANAAGEEEPGTSVAGVRPVVAVARRCFGALRAASRSYGNKGGVAASVAEAAARAQGEATDGSTSKAARHSPSSSGLFGEPVARPPGDIPTAPATAASVQREELAAAARRRRTQYVHRGEPKTDAYCANSFCRAATAPTARGPQPYGHSGATGERGPQQAGAMSHKRLSSGGGSQWNSSASKGYPSSAAAAAGPGAPTSSRPSLVSTAPVASRASVGARELSCQQSPRPAASPAGRSLPTCFPRGPLRSTSVCSRRVPASPPLGAPAASGDAQRAAALARHLGASPATQRCADQSRFDATYAALLRPRQTKPGRYFKSSSAGEHRMGGPGACATTVNGSIFACGTGARGAAISTSVGGTDFCSPSGHSSASSSSSASPESTTSPNSFGSSSSPCLDVSTTQPAPWDLRCLPAPAHAPVVGRDCLYFLQPHLAERLLDLAVSVGSTSSTLTATHTPRSVDAFALTPQPSHRDWHDHPDADLPPLILQPNPWIGGRPVLRLEDLAHQEAHQSELHDVYKMAAHTAKVRPNYLTKSKGLSQAWNILITPAVPAVHALIVKSINFPIKRRHRETGMSLPTRWLMAYQQSSKQQR
eukprot:GHVT01034834.1.p1 GENE.GHVT01034834.1~~GHVT01034834.1.p1  ORF type:complete len:959 (+),score=208.09 GHVT01034834.1:1216-4092(+)